jgi:hypothetical protein
VIRVTVAALLGAVLLSGCFGRSESACVKPREYQASRSVEPLQVPADLDEPPAQGVEIPPPTPGASTERVRRCLDEPPDYFGR